MVLFKGLEKNTLLDYPGKLAATVFTFGCNFRCPFCQNKELVIEDETPFVLEKDILDYLEKRKDWLDALCITGGEPTLHRDLPIFMKKVKELGLLIKLDTNGTNPEMLEYLIKNNLVDYVAMDIKQIWNKYHIAIGVNTDIEKIKKSVNIIMNSNIDYEFRTTVLPRIHSEEDILGIAEQIKGAKKYYLQQFRAIKTLDPSFGKEKSFDPKKLREIGEKIKPYFKEFGIRGI